MGSTCARHPPIRATGGKTIYDSRRGCAAGRGDSTGLLLAPLLMSARRFALTAAASPSFRTVGGRSVYRPFPNCMQSRCFSSGNACARRTTQAGGATDNHPSGKASPAKKQWGMQPEHRRPALAGSERSRFAKAGAHTTDARANMTFCGGTGRCYVRLSLRRQRKRASRCLGGYDRQNPHGPTRRLGCGTTASPLPGAGAKRKPRPAALLRRNEFGEWNRLFGSLLIRLRPAQGGGRTWLAITRVAGKRILLFRECPLPRAASQSSRGKPAASATRLRRPSLHKHGQIAARDQAAFPRSCDLPGHMLSKAVAPCRNQPRRLDDRPLRAPLERIPPCRSYNARCKNIHALPASAWEKGAECTCSMKLLLLCCISYANQNFTSKL